MRREYRLLSTYNRIRIINILEEMLAAKGAKILRSQFDDPLEIKCYTNEDDRENKIENLPVIIAQSKSLHIKFLLNGYYYDFSFDDNPFFPMSYHKIKVDDNGNYIGKRYLYQSTDGCPDTLTESTMCYDNIFRIVDDNCIKSMAEDWLSTIEEYITSGAENKVVSDRVRVPNYYDGGYHYENKYDQTKCSIFYNERLIGSTNYVKKEEN